MKKHFSRGFTLIELLVVIAVIGVLASVILSSLNSARSKAKDAAVRQGAREFEKLLALEYSNTGSYANLQANLWIPNQTTCAAQFGSSTYATQARAICQNLVQNAPNRSDGYVLFTGNAVDLAQKYSILVGLNTGTDQTLCVGSSGIAQTTIHNWGPLGCYSNP